jgi:hypothetical protein
MRNDYEVRGNTVAIFLKNRRGDIYETLIDLEDLERLEKINLSWHLEWNKRMGDYYCKATEYLGIIDGVPKYRTIRLHQFIANSNSQHVDHLNHNILDNRKCNLSIVSVSVNSLNRECANKNSSTGVRNVSYAKGIGKYIVQLQIDGKNIIFGKFDNVEDARKCAEENREKYYPKIG